MSFEYDKTSFEQAPASNRDMIDALTGLGNRHQLRVDIETLVQQRAHDPAPFTVGIANIDGFKPINDLFGIEAGDRILIQVAHRLKSCLPEGSSAMRYQGDSIAFVMPMVFEAKSAERVGQVIKDALSAPYNLGERQVRLSASFGFAIHPFAGGEFTELMKSADTALYRAKRRGRGQITVYSREIAQEMKRATQLEQALRNAIIEDTVEVHFQPIVRLDDKRVIGFEALARWNDPDLGQVSPAVFVPLAEERGFIDALSESLLRKAAETALSWPRELFLSFNLSSAQLMDPNIVDTILSILARVGLDPRRLELEITETAVVSCSDTAERIIADLRRAGVRISLDDFGTGQSSLGRLRDFSFDKIKIDRAFVSRIRTDRPSEHIIKAIVTMCEGLDLEVVAEGIEESLEAEKLMRLGCSMGQGYYFGRPVDASATTQFLAANYRGGMAAQPSAY